MKIKMKKEKALCATPIFPTRHSATRAGCIPSITIALVAFAFALPAATTKPATAKGEATNPALLPLLPQSVFVIPKKPTEGKDPFFPGSTRVHNVNIELKPKVTEVVVGDLYLKGISGTAAEPLAIINNITFTTGEDNDVLTSAGRMRVRCIEINMAAGTALVQVGGQRRELRLQAKK